jgi:hypothetical protein
MVDKLTVGPLFHISGALRASKLPNTGAVFTAFGYAFENYTRTILETVYGKPSNVLANRFSSPFLRIPRKKEREPREICDGCLNDVSDLVLLELKARWIGDDTVYSDDPNHYLAELKKKLAKEQSNLPWR